MSAEDSEGEIVSLTLNKNTFKSKAIVKYSWVCYIYLAVFPKMLWLDLHVALTPEADLLQDPMLAGRWYTVVGVNFALGKQASSLTFKVTH